MREREARPDVVGPPGPAPTAPGPQSPQALMSAVAKAAGNRAAAGIAPRLLMRSKKPWEADKKGYVLKALKSPKRSSFQKHEQSLEIGGRLCMGYATAEQNAKTAWTYSEGMQGIGITKGAGDYPYTMTFGGDFVDEVNEHNIDLQGARVKDVFRVPDLIDQLQTKYKITLDTGSRYWDAADLDDVATALGLLSAREAARLDGWTVRRVRDQPPHGDADTDPKKKLVRLSNFVFPRTSIDEKGTKSDPGTLYGRPRGVHVILHEVGHVLDGMASLAGKDLVPGWTPHYNRIRAAGRRVSSEPKGDPTKFDDFEVMCEAFARFKNDPAGLATADPGAAGFFSTGQHVP